jgi:hypothetical protein
MKCTYQQTRRPPTKYGDYIASRRMEKAGLTTVHQIISELAIDWTSAPGQKLVPILRC